MTAGFHRFFWCSEPYPTCSTVPGIKVKEANKSETLQALNSGELSAQILTAYPLSKDRREKLQQILQELSQRPLHCNFEQDSSLLAGARIELGPWLLQANLQDELQAFAEFEHNTPIPLAHE